MPVRKWNNKIFVRAMWPGRSNSSNSRVFAVADCGFHFIKVYFLRSLTSSSYKAVGSSHSFCRSSMTDSVEQLLQAAARRIQLEASLGESAVIIRWGSARAPESPDAIFFI